MKRSPIVYFLFLFSGITALIYEVVWTRMLTLAFGHTVFSVSIVLASFMAGLGFGSYFSGHAINHVGGKKTHSDSSNLSGELSEGLETSSPLLIYGWIEIALFLVCLIVSLILFKFSFVYSWFSFFISESTLVQNIFKSFLAFILMFVPASLMGATLPIISKYYITDNIRLDSRLGLLYGINTIGAALGCLLTGFFLIANFGVLQTVLAATLLNLFIGISAIRIYQESLESGQGLSFPSFTIPKISFKGDQWFWIFVSFVCGFTALAYEVLWTRLLVFSTSSTVYSFSMMLGVFLIGIALGSFLVVAIFRSSLDLRTVLIFLQVSIGLYVIGSLYNMEQLLSAPWNGYNLQKPAFVFWRYFLDSSALMLFPTIALGMSFPILIKIISDGYEHIGKGTGQIYGGNTFGAILGSLFAGFLFLPRLGAQQSLLLVATLNLLMGMYLFRSGNYLTKTSRKIITVVLAGVILTVNMGLPSGLLDQFFMRDGTGKKDIRKLLFFEEGLTDTVAAFEDNYGILDPEAKRLITNGVSMSAVNLIASRYMKLLAHLPIMLVENPEKVLVVCFGTGQTTGAAAVHPKVKSVDSVDLSASVVKAGSVFSPHNYNVLKNEKVNIILQDGRNHLLTTQKIYDVITSEPPPPRTAFTVNLYTKEYYETAKKHLKAGGIMAQWIPLHSQGKQEVLMHFKTFLSVFPHAIAWIPVANEIIVIGSDRPIDIDFEKLKGRFLDPTVSLAMQEIQVPDAFSFLSNIWFLEDEMNSLAKNQKEITDNWPAIEFYLDLGNVVGVYGREDFLFARTPFKNIADRISNITYDEQKRLEGVFDGMSLYQRGVTYSNRELLLESLSKLEESDLVRYHLQASSKQVSSLMQEVKSNPSNLEALLNLGHAFYQIGEYEKSFGILKIILTKDVSHPYANLYAGYNLMELERRKEAKVFFKAAIKNNRAQFSSIMQEIALVDLHSQLDADPENLGLLNAVASFYNIRKEYKKSLDYSIQVLKQEPLNKQALKNIVFGYRGRGEAGDVLDYGNRYAMVDPDDINLQYVFGEIFAKTLRCQKAIPYLQQVIKKDDTYRNAEALLSQCLQYQREEEISAS
ncbi:MAG TPA: spermidine synthase [Nitrospina sp.]|nr:spermidine synthase [Nitrospina sp.]